MGASFCRDPTSVIAKNSTCGVSDPIDTTAKDDKTRKFSTVSTFSKVASRPSPTQNSEARCDFNTSRMAKKNSNSPIYDNQRKFSCQCLYNPHQRLDEEGQTLAGVPGARTHISKKVLKRRQNNDGESTLTHLYARRYLPAEPQEVEKKSDKSEAYHYDPNDFGQFYRHHYQTFSLKNCNMVSAIVPRGIGSLVYNSSSLSSSPISGVPSYHINCIDEKNSIYIIDIGLSRTQCDYIIQTADECADLLGYTAYTYAKQTLGCREHDALAMICEWPVQRAYHTIKNLSSSSSKLVLDDREPHIVKYDLTRKERQKLDVHTDKSEWTFLISLNTQNVDFQGGGTYFECMNSVIHVQCGHCLIFPGKLRHAGRKISSGERFLLVGFCICEKTRKEVRQDNSESENNS